MPIVVGGKTIPGTTPYADPERTEKAIEQAVKEYEYTNVKTTKPKRDTGIGTKEDPVKATTVTQPDRELSEYNTSLIDALKSLGITKSVITGVFTTPLTITAAAQEPSSQQYLYKISTNDGQHVNIVEATDVYEAASKYGTYIGDPDISIRSVEYGCYPLPLTEAREHYEKDPLPLGSYTPSTPRTPPEKNTGTTVVSGVDLPADANKIDPIPILPTLITKYTFKLNDGTVKEFEAMTEAEAVANVNKYDANLDSLSVVGHRPLSQYEIEQALRGAASHSDMDYARALIKYGQVEGVVPVRDGDTGEAMLISEADWNSMPKEYRDIVLEDGLQALNKTIYNELPEKYQLIADEKDLAEAIAVYNADVERANEVLDKLKPYKDGDNYDIVTPLETGVVTGDDLRVAGFDTKDVKAVEDYVNKLSTHLTKWDKYIGVLRDAVAKHKDKEPQIAALEISREIHKVMPPAEIHDFYNAITESGAIKKYGLGGVIAEIESLPNAEKLADKWRDMSLQDKYNIAEIYAAYPAPNKLLTSGYRGMIAQAPDMNAAARFAKEFVLGGAAGTLQPFVKEQYKDNLETILKNYKEDDGYNITEYLKDNPEDANILARGGVDVKDLEKALNGQRVITQIKGATAKDWAVAGLIVTAVGAGGASFAVTGLAKSALITTSGLATLGLGTYATIDTVKYWPQMDNTQRAIAVAFDVLLLTTGAMATKGGLTSFKQQGGFTQIRNKIMYNYRAARNVIKKLLPNSTKADSILYNLKRAIESNDPKLLKAAARQLELEAAKMPKELGEALQNKARLLQAAPDDVLKLRNAPKDAPDDVAKAIDNLTADIAAMEKALRRVKDPKRYNSIKQALEQTMIQREALQKTRVATKQKTTVPLQEPVEAGKYVPAKAGTTTAVTKAKPTTPVKMPSTIEAGTKKVPIETIRKKTPSEVAQKHFVSIWDISRAIRKLPKGVQEEIALYSPEWAIVVKTKGATITATKTALRRNLKQLQEQEPKPAAVPSPKPATQTQPQPATKTQPKQKKKLTEKEALATYPFFQIPQDVQTRYKRKRRTPDMGESEIDITERLPRDRSGIITRKQGLFYITIFPPYRKQDRIFTKKKPYYAESGRGKGSPQRTLKTVGGKVPKLVRMPLGVVTTNIKDGKVLTFEPRSVSRRRHKGRRRGTIVY